MKSIHPRRLLEELEGEFDRALAPVLSKHRHSVARGLIGVTVWNMTDRRLPNGLMPGKNLVFPIGTNTWPINPKTP